MFGLGCMQTVLLAVVIFYMVTAVKGLVAKPLLNIVGVGCTALAVAFIGIFDVDNDTAKYILQEIVPAILIAGAFFLGVFSVKHGK